jgi:hypothetical protein
MAIFVLLSFAVAAVAFAAVTLRFRYLRPASLAFVDSRSAELWHELRRRRPLLVFTDSLLLAGIQHLSDRRETLQADAPRVFVHFGSAKRTVVPTVCVYEEGCAYLMEVAYKDQLATVLLAVLAGLRPLCAITMGRQRPAHPAVLWLQLLWELDGPPWFVLCSVMTPKRQIQFLYDGREPLEAWKGEHAGT